MKPNLYIPALTGVRAIAAYLVFFHHFNQPSFPYPVFRVLNEFHIGVTIFFVLSGFLICFRYFDNCEISGAWFRKYIKNRIARIYPMYFLLTLATFGVAASTNDTGIYNSFPWHGLLLFLNLFFFRGFFDDLKFTGLGQGWSLTVEECFYLLAPFFFIQIKKNKTALLYLPAATIGFGLLLVAIFSHVNWWGFYGNTTFLFLYTFTGRCVEFFMGMALAIVLLRTRRKQFAWPVFTIIGVVWIAFSVGILASLPLTETRKFGVYHPFGIFTNNIILPIGVTLLFYGIITEKSWFNKLLSSNWMQILGKSSYIFYLLHIGFIATATSGWVTNLLDNVSTWLDDHEYEQLFSITTHPLTGIFTVFVILNGISFLLWHFIEEPMNHIIRKSAFLAPRTTQ